MFHPIGNGLYIKTPKKCHGCPCFWHEGIHGTRQGEYYLDARCKLVEATQDWYFELEHRANPRGGWVGDDLDEIDGYDHGYYQYHHAVKEGTRAKQCPLSGKKGEGHDKSSR